jgi:hypothetical protein
MFHLCSACERVTRSIALSSGLRALLDMHNSLNELAGRGKVSVVRLCCFMLQNQLVEVQWKCCFVGFQCVHFSCQVAGFKICSLDHLVSLKSYDGKTTLGQLMVQQVCHTHNGNHKRRVSRTRPF